MHPPRIRHPHHANSRPPSRHATRPPGRPLGPEPQRSRRYSRNHRHRQYTNMFRSSNNTNRRSDNREQPQLYPRSRRRASRRRAHRRSITMTYNRFATRAHARRHRRHNTDASHSLPTAIRQRRTRHSPPNRSHHSADRHTGRYLDSLQVRQVYRRRRQRLQRQILRTATMRVQVNRPAIRRLPQMPRIMLRLVPINVLLGRHHSRYTHDSRTRISRRAHTPRKPVIPHKS